MKKQTNNRQLSFNTAILPESIENVFNLTDQLSELSDFAPIQNLIMTLSGSIQGIQISGDPNQVKTEFSELTEKTFTNCTINVSFPNKNNLVLNISINFALGQINSTIQNGDDISAKTIFQIIIDNYPRLEGPSDKEFEEKSLRLSNIIKEAEKTVKIVKQSEDKENNINIINDKVTSLFNGISENKEKSDETLNLINKNNDIISQKSQEITNIKNQSQADYTSIQNLHNKIGAKEAKIKEFYTDIENYKNKMNATHKNAETLIQKVETNTNNLLEENKKLQEETKQHLLKAVGTSLFSAFEKRKKKIVISKWIWASITLVGIITQACIIIWLASEAKNLPENVSFYSSPPFLLRATASIPIIFFIGYAIHQYSREREFEELYGFKSVLSFSLSPYLDLVNDLSQKSENENHKQFVIDTIKQVFENPINEKSEKSKKSFFETNIIKDVLDRVIQIIEKR